MKTGRARLIFGRLRKAVQPSADALSDGQLLGQYVARRDAEAFAALVRRHGPMVYGVCRRVLRHPQDAEDAFQATFLVLVRKATRLADRQTVGGWLHGVALNAALDARRRSVRRKARELHVEHMRHPLIMPAESNREELELLDRELARLPEKLRLPVVLCELEGRSRKQAASQLRIPEGTLSSRLAAARKTLARRMAAQGAAVTGASLTALFASEAGAACVPASLLSSTVRVAGGVVPAGVAALVEGVLKAMLLTKIKTAALALLVVASACAVTFTLNHRAAAQDPQPAVPSPQPRARVAGADKDDLEALRLEVEALRLELKATREQVKTLDGEIHGGKSAAGDGPGTKRIGGYWLNPNTGTPEPPSEKPTTPPGEANDAPKPTPAVEKATDFIKRPGTPAAPNAGGTTPAVADDLVTELEAALQQARTNPTKESMEALDRALVKLRRSVAPKPSPDVKPVGN